MLIILNVIGAAGLGGGGWVNIPVLKPPAFSTTPAPSRWREGRGFEVRVAEAKDPLYDLHFVSDTLLLPPRSVGASLCCVAGSVTPWLRPIAARPIPPFNILLG